MFQLKELLTFLIFGTVLMVGDGAFGRFKGQHNVTRNECINAINSTFVEKRCCHEMVEVDSQWINCVEIQNLRFKSNRSSVNLMQLSMLAECIYTEKNYIKTDTQLNMKSVRADANRLYHNDSMQKHFMINMYKDCGRRAKILNDDVKKYPENEEFVRIAHKPYFMFVFNCVYYYSRLKCPYFRWEGLNELDTRICADYAAQCKRGY